jgi:hypothetical protein
VSHQKRFQGIARSVTLSKPDLKRLLNSPLEEVDDWLRDPFGADAIDEEITAVVRG